MTFDFSKLYRKCKRTNALANGVEVVRETVRAEIKEDVYVEKYEIKSFATILGYKVKIKNNSAFYPLEQSQQPFSIGKWGIVNTRKIFLEVDSVVPPYIANRYLNELVGKMKRRGADKQRIINRAFYEMYPWSRVAQYCTEIYRSKKAFSPFFEQIVESCEAFYMGLDKVAITALLPCVEGIIRNIGLELGLNCSQSVDKLTLLKALKLVQRKYIDELTFGQFDWVPTECKEVEYFDQFHEGVQMIESLKYYFENQLYEHTSNLNGQNYLNRHGILHGFPFRFSSPSNFYRLITILNLLSFASIIAGDTGSLLGPSETIQSKRLGDHFHMCGEFVISQRKRVKRVLG